MDYATLLTELPGQVDRSLFKVERWITPEEGRALQTLIQAHDVCHFLECGTANGYSALWAAAAGAAVCTWDIVDRPKIWDHVPELAELANQRIAALTEPFGDRLETEIAASPALWFIDGDHSPEGVRKDWRIVRQFALEGDVVVFHDALCIEGILQLWEELIHSFRGGMIRTERGMGVIFPEQFRPDAASEDRAREEVRNLHGVPVENRGEPLIRRTEAP